ncbi:Uncharacterised protein at_DN0631, partial [Pycnogonum litorale]
TIVVFDGYDGPSTKDHEHQRRKARTISATIDVKLGRICHNDQASFLANDRNKSRLIALISERLRCDGHVVKQAQSDADYRIAKSALEYAREGNEVVLIAEDCDITVMLVHHFEFSMADIGILKFSKTKRHGELYTMRNIVTSLDPSVKSSALFIHGWSGCDTTSGTYSQGKLSVLRLSKNLMNFVK